MIANAKEWASSSDRYDNTHLIVGLRTLQVVRVVIVTMCRFEHPYQYELDHFEPTEEQLALREPQVSGVMGTEVNLHPPIGRFAAISGLFQEPGSLEDVPLTLVETVEQLDELKGKLMSVSEFAIDLEVRRGGDEIEGEALITSTKPGHIICLIIRWCFALTEAMMSLVNYLHMLQCGCSVAVYMYLTFHWLSSPGPLLPVVPGVCLPHADIHT